MMGNYLDVRSSRGKLLFRYDPYRGIVEIQERGVKEYIDLTQILAERQERQGVLGGKLRVWNNCELSG